MKTFKTNDEFLAEIAKAPSAGADQRLGGDPEPQLAAG